MMFYHCELCIYKTGSRADIRKHLKKVHKMTGGHKIGEGGIEKTPISEHYTRW